MIWLLKNWKAIAVFLVISAAAITGYRLGAASERSACDAEKLVIERAQNAAKEVAREQIIKSGKKYAKLKSDVNASVGATGYVSGPIAVALDGLPE